MSDPGHHVRASGERSVGDVHSTTYRHVDGVALDGARRYELTFNPGVLSEAGHFWSLTVYGLDCDLAETRIDRYSIGDRTPWLQSDPDGGMTLVVQHERPNDAGVRNWLPAPEGEFCLVFRTDGPVRPVMDHHAWHPPAVRVRT